MKKRSSLFRTAAVVLAALLALALLGSCSGKTTLSGIYSGELGGSLVGAKASYNFKGDKVTLTVTTTILGASSSTSYDGTYEIKTADDKTQSIAIAFSDSGASVYNGEFAFSQDKEAGTISIGMVTYTKQ